MNAAIVSSPQAPASNREVRLPRPRGPWSSAVLGILKGAGNRDMPRVRPMTDDLHLALYLAYLPHYRSLPGVSDDREWDPQLQEMRQLLEARFDQELDAGLAGWTTVGTSATAAGPIARRLRALVDEASKLGPPVAEHLSERAPRWQFIEFLTLKSAYHLMEADPHSWAIPRATGRAKAALVEIQADEYGGGDPEAAHQRLFADLLTSVGLPTDALGVLDQVPGTTLATSNVITRFAIHRALLPRAIGHLAAFEMTSTGPNRDYARGARRVFGDEVDARFFDVHVAADAVHEQIAAADLAGGLVADRPEAASEVMAGARSALWLERRAGDAWLSRWQRDQSALL